MANENITTVERAEKHQYREGESGRGEEHRDEYVSERRHEERPQFPFIDRRHRFSLLCPADPSQSVK